ncbi:MAG: phospho-N-acetylmuramoyl-pentapeptide-transferase [Spirochaetia bacterium]|nr:phospho-N-acetylmuramoyl-pentapeptide-transferase [Spirochaetota bacterium]MCX8096542.1 phospho-N-acetylmuramoyl-pentapeptide-transferase [Spirochaetota bacterium]MDW8112700.1 phospho-N-acetylmuramoyl-pentapeptide-transferase [Spirochaetia bacterium]
MLYDVFFPLRDWFFGFNLFRYITFRTLMASLTAFLIVFIIMPKFIEVVSRLQFKQNEREFGPQSHLKKQNTPTMGGFLFILSSIISSILWARMNNIYIPLILSVMFAFGFIGFMDDYLKRVRRSHRGLSILQKYSLQLFFSFLFIISLYLYPPFKPYFDSIFIPYTNNVVLTIPLALAFVFYILVITGSSNAVNLTDGIDGLAAGLAAIAFAVFGLFAYLAGNIVIANYLLIPYIDKVGEVAVVAGSIVGALGGFLWYNAHPAKIFMGDTGALSLGATLGAISIITKQELLLVIVGMVFVMETLSTAIQIVYYRLTGGKRIFRMAPLHHHFELGGWSEPQVLIRFWILGVIFAVIALASLKIR